MTSLTAYHRTRPIRVAFLVEDHEHFSAMLDAIFANCHSRWGGRFNLIVPCEVGSPLPGYDVWLEKYDPDIIYSYIDLTEQQIDQFHEKLYPSYLVRHKFYGRDIEHSRRDYNPEIPMTGLASISLLEVAERRPQNSRPREILVAGCEWSEDHDGFVEDSFGTFTSAFLRGPFPRELSNVAREVTVVMPEKVNPMNGYTEEDETVPTASDLVRRMTNQSLTTFSQLASANVSRHELRPNPISETFSIVVGDSFVDRIVYWNSRSLFPLWLDQTLVSMRIPANKIEDDDFIDALAGYLKSKNNVMFNNQRNATIRSHGTDVDVLEQFRDKLVKHDKWSRYKVGQIQDACTCVPEVKNWKHSPFLNSGGGLGSGIQEWEEAIYESSELRVSPIFPSHLRNPAAEIVGFSKGAWAVDLDIERENNLSGISNVHHRWRLPRRLRLVSAFSKSYQFAGMNSQFAAPRVSRGGLLTMFSTIDARFPAVTVPTDDQALRSGMILGRDWWPFTPPKDNGSGMPQQICTSLLPSTQGRYLNGVIGLFGGFENATEIILHKLWIELFERLGASSNTTDTRIENITGRLAKKFSDNIDLHSAKTTEALSKEVLKIARELRFDQQHLTWSLIKKTYLKYFNEYNEKHFNKAEDESIEDVTFEELDHDVARFEKSVKALCANGVLHQGIFWKCGSCYHKNWVSIGRLNSHLVCEVCEDTNPAPIDREWDFLLNSFLAMALRDHAIQSILWTLNKIAIYNSASFYFLGPNDIYYGEYPEDANGQDGDVDLICVQDGIVRCCEVKQSDRNLDLDNFLRVVKRMRPDKATLSVMMKKNRKITTAFANFTNALANSGIEPELLCLDDDFDDSPYFGGTRVRVF